MIINDVPIISVKGNYCSVHFCYMSKYEAVNEQIWSHECIRKW